MPGWALFIIGGCCGLVLATGLMLWASFNTAKAAAKDAYDSGFEAGREFESLTLIWKGGK